MVGWIGRGSDEAPTDWKLGMKPTTGVVHRFRFVGRHPVGSWFRNGVCSTSSRSSERKRFTAWGTSSTVGNTGQEGPHFTPTAVQFAQSLEFRPHLGHAFVVGEVVEHETQSIERSLATVEHMCVSG